MATDKNLWTELDAARKALAAEKKRADDAQMMLYDRYFCAALTGICARPTQGQMGYNTLSGQRELLPGEDTYGTIKRAHHHVDIVNEAERITFACLRAREIYKLGMSPNEPPKPQRKPSPQPKAAKP